MSALMAAASTLLSTSRAPVFLRDQLRTVARECALPLVGFAPAEPLDPRPLLAWLERGYGAGLSAMRKRVQERADPNVIVPNAKTVVVFGIPYGPQADPLHAPVIARYARGRDYHYAHRDRMRAFRHRLCAIDPSVRTYACVDSGAAMEKAWAERAGLGFIGKNGLLIHREYGSWLTLSLMVLDRAMNQYDEPHPRLCGSCERCLHACPANAFPSPGVLDANRCLSYHTVENHGTVPDEIREHLGRHVFGCDDCQELCPFNRPDIPPGDPRQAPRPLGQMDAVTIAALSQAQYDELAVGTPMRRIGYHGLRRNACLSLGSTRDKTARALLTQLTADPNPTVAEAATWALSVLS
jgi:epoxyqueuosine reductase